MDGVATSRRDLHAIRAVLCKEIITSATRSTAGVLKDPLVINWKYKSGPITVDKNTVVIPPRTTTQVLTGTRPSSPPIIIGSQKIEGPRRSIITQEVRITDPLNTFINIITSKHRYPTPIRSKAISSKIFTNKSADVYAQSRMNFGSDTVLSKSPNFMDFGLSSVNTMDELGSVFIITNRIGRPMGGSNWILSCHDISESTADRVSRTKAKNHYNFKSEFEARRDKMVDQDFGHQNDLMSRPTLDSTTLGKNTTNGTTSPIDSIIARTKTLEPTPLTQPIRLRH